MRCGDRCALQRWDVLPPRWRGGLGWGGARQGLCLFDEVQPCENRFHDAVDIVVHITVGDAQGFVAARGKPGIAGGVFFRGVRVAVDLNDEVHPVADEIGEVWAERRLTAEMVGFEQWAAQVPPDRLFRRGHVAA